jgi:hypothetical protein
MKHRSASLLRRGSRLVRLRALPAVALLAACDAGHATLVVLSDTTATTASRVVVALPFDPAALPAVHPAAMPRGSLGDSVRLAFARRDSALAAGGEFRRTRDAANALAQSLAPLDRRRTDYARRFAEWSALADSAERLRSRRDALARRLGALRARLGDAALLIDGAPSVRHRGAADSAAGASGRQIAEATLTNGSATLELVPGDWWIARAAPDGALRLPAVRRGVVAGGRDTVEVR